VSKKKDKKWEREHRDEEMARWAQVSLDEHLGQEVLAFLGVDDVRGTAVSLSHRGLLTRAGPDEAFTGFYRVTSATYFDVNAMRGITPLAITSEHRAKALVAVRWSIAHLGERGEPGSDEDYLRYTDAISGGGPGPAREWKVRRPGVLGFSYNIGDCYGAFHWGESDVVTADEPVEPEPAKPKDLLIR
jgi:hypothetical protein